MSRLSLKRFPLFACLFMIGFATLFVFRPVPVVKSDAPQNVFSAQRAHQHICAIGRQPHPAGTPQAKEVRDYIWGQLTRLGLRPALHESVENRTPGQTATPVNIMARIYGTGGPGAGVVALVTHYDSVSTGPGAADDGAGCAALLEAARAILADKPLKNDVALIFTDGEEGRGKGSGLRGARALSNHPWHKEIDVFINFDCRGFGGPSYIYETSRPNGWLIREMSRSDARVLASSLMYEIYSRTPLGSDFSVLVENGLSGYDCAFIRGLTTYHTAEDVPSKVDLRSVQHHGEYALKLCKHLASIPLKERDTSNYTYFNVIGYELIYYPESLILPITLLMAFLAGLCVALAVRKGYARPCRIAVAFFKTGLFIVLGGGLSFAVIAVLFKTIGARIVYGSDPLMLAFIFTSAAVWIGIVRKASGKNETTAFTLGAWLWWVAFAAAASIALPGAAYLFQWAGLCAFSGMALLLVFGKEDPLATPDWRRGLLLVLFLAPGICITTPIILGTYTCVTVIFSILLLPVFSLLLALIVPGFAWSGPRSARFTPILFVAASIALVGLFAYLIKPCDSRKLWNSVNYAMDLDSGKGWFLSNDPRTDRWTGQFFPDGTGRQEIREFYPDCDLPALKAEAPVRRLAAPLLEKLEDRTEGDKRYLKIRASSPRGGHILRVYALDGTDILSARMDGVDLMPVEGAWNVTNSILPTRGFEIELESPAGKPVHLHALDITLGLPVFPEKGYQPRSTYMMPLPNTIDYNRSHLKTDETLVAKKYEF